MPKATASPLIVPLSGTSPRELTILPPSVSPACVNTASEAREPIGLSTLSSHVPVTSVILAAAGGGGGADWVCGVEQAAAIDATAARHRRRKPGAHEVDIEGTPFVGASQLNRCPSGVRAIGATVDVSSAPTKPAPCVPHPIEGTPDRAFASLGLKGLNAAGLQWSNRATLFSGRKRPRPFRQRRQKAWLLPARSREFIGAHHLRSHP